MVCGYVLFVFAFIATSVAEECVTYDFEEDFNDVFNFAPICQTIVAARWSQVAYEATIADSPHELSTRAIMPSSRESCTSSFTFTMQGGGLLQVNVFMRPLAASDNINVMVYEKMANGADRAVRGASLRSSFGLNTLNVTIPETMETFEGYFLLTGTSGFSSTVLVDSFRYLPPDMDETACVIYGEGGSHEQTEDPISEPTEDPISEPTENPISETTEEPVSEPTTPDLAQEVCTTTRFLLSDSENFDQKGTICGMLSEWTWMEYNDLPGVAPIETSESFISSDTSPSCISSFDFDMRTDGILEVNVFLDGTGNQLIVSVHRSDDDGSYTLVVEEEHTASTEGNWYAFNISLPRSDDIAIFKGHVTLTGNAAGANTLLVDSFRFYSPGNEDNCTIYSGDPEVTPIRDVCTTSYFDEDDYKGFDQKGTLCGLLSKWNRNSPETPYESFIYPQNQPSCISSFEFDMRTDGILEVNVEMGDDSLLLVTVYRADDNLHIPIVEKEHTTNTGPAMYTLNISLPSSSDNIAMFKGYITFTGRAATSQSVKVDSFRFYSPERKDNCTIYDEALEEVCINSQLSKSDFDKLFDPDDTYCNMFEKEWNWLPYLTDGPFQTTESLIFPDNISPSCISTHSFKMKSESTLEIKLFMKGEDDLLRVIVYKAGTPTPIAIKELTQSTNNEWSTLKMILPEGDNAVFDGHVTLVGFAAEPKSVLVDSFRFYSPGSENDCVPFPEVCKINDITAEDFDKFEPRDTLCALFGRWTWTDEIQYPLTLGSLTPGTTLSCISSYDFDMRLDGTFELKLFMRNNGDFIRVTVYRTNENGLHSPIGMEERGKATNGWEPLTISLGGDDRTIFKGHVTLMGSSSEVNGVLVDSFRFSSPENEDCPPLIEM